MVVIYGNAVSPPLKTEYGILLITPLTYILKVPVSYLDLGANTIITIFSVSLRKLQGHFKSEIEQLF
jgi:hypothetical protein